MHSDRLRSALCCIKECTLSPDRVHCVKGVTALRHTEIRDTAKRSFFLFFSRLAEGVVEDEENSQYVESDVEILPLSREHFDEHITEDTKADTVSDGVTEYHRNHRDEEKGE